MALVAPSNVQAQRASGPTRNVVVWMANGSIAEPYTDQDIQRRTNGGAWGTVHTISGNHTGVMSWDDSTINAQHGYEYRIIAWQRIGGNWFANSAPSNIVQGTPLAPESLLAQYSTATRNRLTWRVRATPYRRVEFQTVQVSVNGGTWTDLETLGTSYSEYGAHAFNHNGVSRSNSYRYRVIAGNLSGTATSGLSDFVWALPAAPGTPSVSRTSDTRHTLGWSRNATTYAPYESQRVQRRVMTQGSWSAWVTRANVSGTTTSYTDTTAANRVFQYRVEAVNTTGRRTSGASVLAYTTPDSAASVVATRPTSDDIRVRITPPDSLATSNVNFEIHHSDDGGPWTPLATVNGSRSAVNYTHVSPGPSASHRYRVRIVISSSGQVGDGLTSGWRTSNSVPAHAPPLAPTGLGPSTPHDATEPRTLHWTHNPTDGSEQNAFGVRHRVAGGTWSPQTGDLTEVSQWVLPGGTYDNGAVVEWAVLTYSNSHSTASPWSATASFVTSARPTAAISAPEDGETVADSTLTVLWAYFQAEDSPQAQWRATLLDEFDNTVEVLSGSGDTSEATFATPILDERSYTVRVEVASAVGLWSEPVDAHFSVAYPPPALVDTELLWDRDSGTVALTLTAQAWDGVEAVEPIAATIERSVDGEVWEVVHHELPLDGGVTGVLDVTPHTRAEVLYRVTSISELPSMSVAEPVAIVVNEMERCYLSFGPQFENVLVFYGNLKRSTTAAREETIEHFSGRVGENGLPAGVIISGQVRSREFGVAATLLMADGLATAEDFEEAAFHGGLMCLRTPDGNSGRRVFGKLGGLSDTSEFAPIEGVQFTVLETGRG